MDEEMESEVPGRFQDAVPLPELSDDSNLEDDTDEDPDYLPELIRKRFFHNQGKGELLCLNK